MLFPSLDSANPSALTSPHDNRHELATMSLPNIDLGIKCSYQERQWRIREKRMHKRALDYMKSPLAQDIVHHQASIERTKGLMAHGQRNKKVAAELAQERIRLENNLMADRLLKVQNAVTEITRTNINPQKSRTMVAIRERKKALRSARDLAQSKLDRENAIFLSRLVKTKSAFNRKKWENDYNRHLHIQKNMCRLAVPSYAYDPRGKKKRLRSRSSRKRREVETAEASIVSSWFDDMTPPASEFSESRNLQSASTVRTSHSNGSFQQQGRQHGASASGMQVDRGQIFQDWVQIESVVGSARSHVDVFLVGFRNPETNGMTFEANGKGFTRYVDVPLDVLRAAINSYNGEKRISYISSRMLSLVGVNNDLIWGDV